MYVMRILLLVSRGIFLNLDESGLSLQHRPGRRIAVQRQKHVNVVTSVNKSTITEYTCMCVNEWISNMSSPMVIYHCKNLTQVSTRRGWRHIFPLIDSEHFSEWFAHHFLECTPSVWPLLLLLDRVLPLTTYHSCQPTPWFYLFPVPESILGSGH